MIVVLALTYVIGVITGNIPGAHPTEVVCGLAALAALHWIRKRHE